MPVALTFAFPALWPALAILLLLWAATIILVKPLTALLSKLPVVGGAIARAVGDAVGGLISWARAWASGMVLPLLELLTVPVEGFLGIVAGVVATAEAIIGEVGRVASVAAGQVGAVATRLASTVASVVNLSAIVAGIGAAAAATRALVEATISTTIPAAAAAVQAWARGFVAAAISAAEAGWQLALGGAQAIATAALAAALAPIQRAVALLPAWAQERIAAATAAVAGALGVQVRGVEAQVGQVAAEVGTIAGALTPLLALQLATTIPAIIARAAALEAQCIRPTCSALTPRLPLLNALSSGLMLAAVVNMASSAISDPEGAARETAGMVGTITGLVDDILRPITGVRV